jgi:hypothetical protein
MKMRSRFFAVSDQIRALNSILIDVFDRERWLAFYGDVLGLAVVGEIDDGHVTVLGWATAWRWPCTLPPKKRSDD